MIGTLAMKAHAAGFEVAIVTGDKDFFQLVHDGITVYNPRDDGTWFDAAGVKEKFGVLPEQVVDVLALMGDSIDNIKGVPGIGEKGARDLIAKYGTLEELLAHAGEVTNKRYREGLLNHAEDARQSRELARIRTDVPVRFRSRCPAVSRRVAREVLRAVHATRLPIAGHGVRADRRNGRQGLRGRRHGRRTGRAGRELARARAGSRSACCRTARRRCAPASPGWRSRAHRGTRAYVPIAAGVSTGGLFGEPGDATGRACRSTDGALGVLTPLLEDEALRKIGHDLKFDAIVLARHGITLRGLELDTMIASYLLDSTRSAHPLEELALEHTGYKALREEDVCGRGVKALSFASLPLDAALDFAGERADLALQLSGTLHDLLEKESLVGVYDALEQPLIPVLVEIERAGVRVDVGALSEQSSLVEQELDRLAARVYELAGEEFNINSPKKLSEVLFDKLGFRTETIRRTTKTKAQSTSFEVLEELALPHELPQLILEWRGLQKLKGTYIDALPQLVHPETGRVHTCFNQAVAATGRLSSSDPNLQNIPIRTEVGRNIRRAFVAEPGNVLISADYSQIELRVLAHLSGEQVLVDAFARGEDIHDRTAAKVFRA